MPASYDLQAARKAANLSVNSDLLRQARELGINLSATLEQALAEAVRQQRAAEWRLANARAIVAYNDGVDQDGTFGDQVRGF